MLKKILLTALVILGAYLFIRWRQKREPVVVTETQPEKQGTAVYYLAGAVITLMIVSAVIWFYYTLN